MPTRLLFDNKFIIDYESMEKRQDRQYGFPLNDAKFTIYTDGSLVKKSNFSSAGAGLYIWNGYARGSYRLGENVSVWQAELFGVKKAAQFIIKNYKEVEGEICVIYVDSQSCIKSLGCHESTSQLLNRTISLLNAAASKCQKLIIRWIRSHQNNDVFIGNQNSDYWANLAANNPQLPVEYDAPKPSYNTLKAKLRDFVYDHFSKEWLKVDHGRQTKHFFPSINKARSYKIIQLPKKIYSRVVQFCTGHCWLLGHCKVVAGPSDPTK